jgi:hypothetical protein
MVLRAGTGASVLLQRSSSGATFVAMMQSIDPLESYSWPV